MTDRNGTSIYLYGFVGLPDGRETLARDGVSGVFLVEDTDVACAVSAVPSIEYEAVPESAPEAERLAWIAPRACRHHDVLRVLHDSAPVVPLKFGTLCEGADQVRAVLHDHRDAIRTSLARFRGNDEWTLQVSGDTQAAAEVARRTDRQLLSLAAQAECLPTGRAYFVRKRLDRIAAELVDAMFAAVEADIYERIVDACAEIGKPEHPKAPPGAAFSVKTPLLIARAALDRVEVLLSELESDHAALGLRFQLVGPWPPYSFAPAFEARGAAATG